MTMSDFASAGRDYPAALLKTFLDSFTDQLASLGYVRAVARPKRATATAFVCWAVEKQLDVATINGVTANRSRRRALADFLEHLRATGTTVSPPEERDHSYAALLQERYENYLLRERGLAEGTVASYWAYVGGFVRRHFATPVTAPNQGLEARDVQDFLLERTRTLAPRTAQLVATALRSFLRFLFLQGETTVDLAFAIPSVPTPRQARVHPYLCPQEIERLLDACDRATANGRRDHAILLLLARLGMRACEVAALELGDLRWRSGEMVVRGKGQAVERLPLLPEIGTALALYLRDPRPNLHCRSVFLRNEAPRVGIGPDGVGFVVRRALARAGLRPPSRGSHLLRFSLATTMIRRGASMTQIGEVLRHRSADSTEIYAKVDFETLRGVALPWLGHQGGGR
jgi:site-specific recombinase XerD